MSKEAFKSTMINAAGNVAETAGRVIDDPKLQKSMGKTATRAMVSAGVMKRTPILRRAKFDKVGAAEAFANPTEAGLLAANQLRKDLPRIAFNVGRASVRAVFEQRRENRAIRQAEAMTEAMTPTFDRDVDFSDASYEQSEFGQAESATETAAAAPSEFALPDLDAIRQSAASEAAPTAQTAAHPELAAAQATQPPDSHEYQLAA